MGDLEQAEGDDRVLEAWEVAFRLAQRPLEKEFEEVLIDNLWELYERS